MECHCNRFHYNRIGLYPFQVLVTCDNGSLDHLKLTKSEGGEASEKQFYFFDRVSTYTEHRNAITGIAKSPSDDANLGGNLVTCSADGSVVAWDLKVRMRLFRD